MSKLTSKSTTADAMSDTIVNSIGVEGPVAVLGAGSWGTALAIQLARAGANVKLWGRDKDSLSAMRKARVNSQYLPDADFPESLNAEPDWHRCLEGVGLILISVPSHGFRPVLQRLKDDAPIDLLQTGLCWATKGLEMSTGLLPHQVVHEVIPNHTHYAVLSGPTFAKEVGLDLPTAITVAASDQAFGDALCARLATERFMAYSSSDIIGVEVGGAVKNVLAIGAGMSDGLGFGANARVALINRGLRELTRLGIAMGAEQETFMGLAGMGDLVLTCTDNLSRNRRMGMALASGATVDEAAKEIQQVVEGVPAAQAVFEKAQAMGVSMPIVEQIFRVLHENKPVQEAVKDLLARARGQDTAGVGT